MIRLRYDGFESSQALSTSRAASAAGELRNATGVACGVRDWLAADRRGCESGSRKLSLGAWGWRAR